MIGTGRPPHHEGDPPTAPELARKVQKILGRLTRGAARGILCHPPGVQPGVVLSQAVHPPTTAEPERAARGPTKIESTREMTTPRVAPGMDV